MSSPSSSIGVSLDAVSLLGFGPESTEALPQASPGEIVLRYGGWSLRELHEKDPDQLRMRGHDKYVWWSEKRPSGVYVLRIPIPGSNRRPLAKQEWLLLPDEEPTSVVLVASALLAIHFSGGEDPLKGEWVRCNERTDDGGRIELTFRPWPTPQLTADSFWSGSQLVRHWFSGCRKIA